MSSMVGRDMDSVALFHLCVMYKTNKSRRGSIEHDVLSAMSSGIVRMCNYIATACTMGPHSFASAVYLCVQEGFTAILKAALNGHLTVVQTLVEQYGGNVLHRNKVQCSEKLLFTMSIY